MCYSKCQEIFNAYNSADNFDRCVAPNGTKYINVIKSRNVINKLGLGVWSGFGIEQGLGPSQDYGEDYIYDNCIVTGQMSTFSSDQWTALH